MSKRSSAGNNSSSSGNSSSKGKDNGNGNSSSSNKKPSAPASPTSNPSDETNFNYFHLPSSSTPAAAYNTMLLPNYANAFPAVQTQPLIPIPPGSMPIPQSLPHFYDASNDSGGDDDDKPGKKRRTNYRRPENAAKLNAAVNALIMQKQDPNAPKDIRSVSKIFNIPYNTLRDNYLRVTTGDVRSLKRPRNDGESSFDGNVSDFGDDGEYHDNDNEHEEDNGSSEDRPPPVPKKKSSKEK